MKVEASNYGRVKVILSNSDLKGLRLSFTALSKPTYTTKLTLLALFKVAAEKLNINADSSKMLIEAYPHLNGSVLYFTPLASLKHKRLTLKENIPLYAYDFYDGSNLLFAIEKLYKCDAYRNTYSKVYDINGIFRLVLAVKNYTVCEYCDSYYPFSLVKEYTCEHGRALTGDNAVYEIGLKCL